MLFTVSVDAPAEVPEMLTCVGESEHVGASLGVPVPWYATVQVRLAAPEKPPTDASCRLAVADPPTVAIVNAVEVTDSDSVDPVPVSDTVCGDPVALSVIVRLPVRLPPAVGVNVTETVQFAPMATLVPQVLVSAKSPEAAMDEMLSAAEPELEIVTVWAVLVDPTPWELNVRLAGDMVAPGPEEVIAIEIAVAVAAAKFVSPA